MNPGGFCLGRGGLDDAAKPQGAGLAKSRGLGRGGRESVVVGRAVFTGLTRWQD